MWDEDESEKSGCEVGRLALGSGMMPKKLARAE